MQLLAKEGGDVLRLDDTNGGASETIVHGSEVFAPAKHNVRSVLDLLDAPVVAGVGPLSRQDPCLVPATRGCALWVATALAAS